MHGFVVCVIGVNPLFVLVLACAALQMAAMSFSILSSLYLEGCSGQVVFRSSLLRKMPLRASCLFHDPFNLLCSARALPQ